MATPAGSDEINQLAQLLDCIADILWCTVCACMQTQHKQVGHNAHSGRTGSTLGALGSVFAVAIA